MKPGVRFHRGNSSPNHVFFIAIMGADRAKFDNAPETFFEDKSVCVTGLIEVYDTKPSSWCATGRRSV